MTTRNELEQFARALVATAAMQFVCVKDGYAESEAQAQEDREADNDFRCAAMEEECEQSSIAAYCVRMERDSERRRLVIRLIIVIAATVIFWIFLT